MLALVGRPPICSAGAFATIVDPVSQLQRDCNCLTVSSLRIQMGSAANLNTKQRYKDGQPSVGTMQAALKRFGLAAPKEKRLGAGKGRSTSTARQRGVGVRSVTSFYVAAAATFKGEVPPEAVLAVDEPPINGNGEHMEAEGCVYEIEQRNANGGAARSASCSSGKRISAVQTISADGHVYLPAMLVAGQKVQLAWTAKPYPETVTHGMVQNMVIIATPNGVETTESFLPIFEHGTLAPARKRINQMHPVYGPFRPGEEGTGLGQKIVVILDCDSTHGVDLKNEECSKELAKLCLKYNAKLVPVPANTPTHLSPLDVAFFGSWKGMLRKVTGVVAMVHSGADASRGICLHPKSRPRAPAYRPVNRWRPKRQIQFADHLLYHRRCVHRLAKDHR